MTVIRNNTLRSLSKPADSSDNDQNGIRGWVDSHRNVLDIFIDAYCIIDVDNRVVDFNVAFTELSGHSFRKIHKIGNFCEILKTELCPHQCPGIQVTTSAKSLRLDEIKASSLNYSDLSLIISAVPLLGNKNQTIGSLLTIRNVTAESELQKKYDDTKRESITDGLTRLFNKAYSEQLLLRSLKATLRSNQPLSFVLADVDFFKKINDTHGHQAGDYILATLATKLKEASRETDLLGRFGGEEFVAILPSTPEEGAEKFAEKFRKIIANHQFIYDGKMIQVTVSLGTSTFDTPWHPALNPDRSTKELINQADTALYYAKANGRNQTCRYETLPKESQ